MTYPQLRAFSRKMILRWRDHLGLRDWMIDLEFVDNMDLMAEVKPDFPNRRAKVRINAALSLWDNEAELEEAIVHELLHIHLGALGVGLGRYSHARKVTPLVMAEQVINALAHCLVALRRKSSP